MDRQTAEAVTFAATMLSMLKKNAALDDRDRANCELAQKKLEAVESRLWDALLMTGHSRRFPA